MSFLPRFDFFCFFVSLAIVTRLTEPPPRDWSESTVADMLENEVYLGNTVNMRYSAKSYKDKRYIDRSTDSTPGPSLKWRVCPMVTEARCRSLCTNDFFLLPSCGR